jgi:hypothetical protein
MRCIPARDISDVDKGVVEGREDVGNSEHILALTSLKCWNFETKTYVGTQLGGFCRLRCLLDLALGHLHKIRLQRQPPWYLQKKA